MSRRTPRKAYSAVDRRSRTITSYWVKALLKLPEKETSVLAWKRWGSMASIVERMPDSRRRLKVMSVITPAG